MAGFGGAVKLTGESEYRKALQQITQSLKEVDSELKLVASQYDKNDRSEEALTAQSEALNKKLEEQQAKVKTLEANLKSLENQAEKNTQEHDKLKEALENETKKLQELEKTCGKNSDEYKTQATVLSELSKTFKKSSEAIDDQEKKLSQARTELNNAKAAAQDTTNAIDKLGNEFKESGDAAVEAGNKAEKSSSGWTVLKGIMADLASNVIQNVISGLRSLIGEAIEAADGLKKFETTMSFAGYDSATIEKAQKDVKDYADKTVYDLNDISNTTAQLAANSVPNFMELTKAAGNLNAVAGGNKDTFKSVAMVLTQTAGAGKLTTENWNQLANAIPGASGKLMEALKNAGAYTGEFREAMSKGQITAEEFNAALMELGNDPIAVEAATSVTTFEGAVGNLQATVVSAFLDIYNAIGSENITGAINAISSLIEKIIPPIKAAVGWFVENLPKIAPLLAAIAGGLTALLIAEKIQALVTAFKAWKAATEAETLAQALLNTVMNANPIMILVTAIGALVAAILYLWNTSDEFREALANTWDSIKKGAKALGDFLKDLFTVKIPDALYKLGEIIVTEGAKILQWIGELPSKIGTFLGEIIYDVSTWSWNLVKKGVTAAVDFVVGIALKIAELPGKILSFLTQILADVGSWALNMARKAKEAATNTFNNIVNTLKGLPGRMLSIGKQLVEGIWDGISGAAGWLGNKIKGFCDGVVSKVKSFFSIFSPSHVFRDEIGKQLALGIGVGFSDEMNEVAQEMENAIPRDFDTTASLTTAMSGVSGLGGSITYTDLVNAFKEALTGVDVELDDIKVGKFVKKTVTDAIYT